MARQIDLRGKNGSVRATALVDDEDYDRLAAYNWFLDMKGYPYRHGWQNGCDRTTRMHRAVLNMSVGDGLVVDHINGDPLDNRRQNLRVGTRALNQQNRRKRAPASSKYRGVTLYRNGKWMAQCHINGKMHHLGYFDDEDDAGAAAAAFRAEHMPWSADASGCGCGVGTRRK